MNSPVIVLRYGFIKKWHVLYLIERIDNSLKSNQCRAIWCQKEGSSIQDQEEQAALKDTTGKQRAPKRTEHVNPIILIKSYKATL